MKKFYVKQGDAFFCMEHGDVFFCSMPLYTLGVCPENRDESNGDNIIKLSLQFIPIFGALHSRLRKGHTTKKDISILFHTQFLRRLMSFSHLSQQYVREFR
jgi:hypothetical protein